LARRKEIYEALHPEAKAEERRKRGVANLKQYSGGETVSPPEDIPAFTSDAAEKTGLSPRTIRQDIQIATKIAPEVRDMIRDTWLADEKKQLMSLHVTPAL